MPLKYSSETVVLRLLQKKYYRHRHCRTYSAEAQTPKPFESIPGLSKLPLIGSVHHFLPLIGQVGSPDNFYGMTKILHAKFGPVVKMDVFSRATMVLLYEPEHFDQVYRAEDVTPLRPGFDTILYYREVLRKDRFKGITGLTIAQGAQWRDFRTKVNPALLKLKLVKLYTPALDEIAKDMVARLAKVKEDDDYLKHNFDLEMTKWSLESVALVALGARIGSLQDDLVEDHPARQLMKCAKDMIDLSFKLEFMPSFWRYFSTPNFKNLVATLDTQWDVSNMYIQRAKKQIDERAHDTPDEDQSVIEKLLAIDEKVAVSMANEMLMAGIDTVALTTTGLLYNLATHPRTQTKLRQEIRSQDPHKRYLRACLKESLRLYPVISANLRRTSKEHVVAGYRIPEGIDVIAPNEYLSKMEKYYPKPLQFVPERWIAEKTDPMYYGNAHPMITQPFGFGIRSCIGRRIAELEIEIFVQRLVQEYNIKWDGPPLKVVTRVMNTFKKPYHFKFEKLI